MYGKIAEEEINNLKNRYKNISIDNYIIMPNHIHLIIKIKEKTNINVGDIICTYKSITTKRCNKKNKIKGKQIWQRNYYEHVIRNEKEYYKILEYMNNNPIRWLEKKTGGLEARPYKIY